MCIYEIYVKYIYIPIYERGETEGKFEFMYYHDPNTNLLIFSEYQVKQLHL